MVDAKRLKKALVMAGGTGGHVFPGLAIADYLRTQGVEVHWLGTRQGMEAKLVPETDIPLHFISINGLRGKGIKPLLRAPWDISRAVKEASGIIQGLKPNVVIGLGGFVSGPGGIASWLQGCPLIIHEQNAKAGTTNKLLTPFAKRILQGFPATFKDQAKVITIGNPVRAEIASLSPPEERFHSQRRFHLLVVGGSLGAQALNEIIPRALQHLATHERPEVLHQTGEKHFAMTQQLYQQLNIEAELQPFIKNMAEAYAWADMVVCRAGALTVTELCAAGLGAIFVPFPHATDDHQTANANFMVKHHAALCIQQSELTDTRLADIIKEFAAAPEKRVLMAKAAYQLRRENVAQKIFEICEEVCH